MGSANVAGARAIQSSMNDPPTTVYHFGPSTDCVGGIASVIETLTTNGLGADRVIAVPTWVAKSHVRSGILVARGVVAVLRVPRPSVIHVHMSEGGSFVREALIVAAARWRRLPCVATMHGAEFVSFSERWPRLVAMVLGMAPVVTVLSETARAAVKRVDADVRVELIPNPVTLDLSAGPVEDAPEVVLFAGEIGVRKGADVLARAWRTVAARRPLARCIMVGPSTELRLPDIGRLEVRGPVERGEVQRLIRQARVIVLPSRSEAVPMILVEASAAGRPFVSTPVGGVESLAGGGTLVPVGDHEALADALTDFLANPEHAQSAGTRGQKICSERMGLNVIDARLRQLYADL
jgi:glycosyltransferase involved in cell wall biosynthesis